jgi:hypothetical protein
MNTTDRKAVLPPTPKLTHLRCHVRPFLLHALGLVHPAPVRREGRHPEPGPVVEPGAVAGRPGSPGHSRYWLPEGILIVEAMARLEMLPLRSFLFMAPLPIENGSGSPLRPLAYF